MEWKIHTPYANLKITALIPTASAACSEARRVPRKLKKAGEKGVSGASEGKGKPGISALTHKCNLSFS